MKIRFFIVVFFFFVIGITSTFAQNKFESDLIFVDDSVCVLKINYDDGERTYITGFYTLKDKNLYFSEASKSFNYLANLEFFKDEDINSDSLEIELLVTDPLGYGWSSMDSLQFRVNGINYHSSLIPYNKHDFIQSHYLKIPRPKEKTILIDAFCQDSSIMMYDKMFFLKDISLQNGYPNKIFFRVYAFSYTDPKTIPIGKLLPAKTVKHSKTYNVLFK